MLLRAIKLEGVWHEAKQRREREKTELARKMGAMSVQELISALQSPQMPERQVACALIAQQQLPEASSALADALCREWEDLNHPPLGEALVKYASEEQIITLAAERLQADDKILLTKFNGRTLPD